MKSFHLARHAVAALLLGLCGLAASAQSLLPAAAPASAPAAEPATGPDARTLVLNQRPILGFRATMLGREPAERAAAARAALDAVLAQDGPGEVSLWRADGTLGVQVDGKVVFYLLPADLQAAVEPGSAPELAADAVRERLQQAVHEVRERSDLRRIAQGLGASLGATLLAWALIQGVFALRRRVLAGTVALLDRAPQGEGSGHLLSLVSQHARQGARVAARGLSWLLIAVVAELWIAFVLQQFALTRPWGERSSAWLLALLSKFALAIAGAVPGLLTAALILFLARLVARAGGAFLQRIERGELSLGWLDADTAGPTRRIGSFVVWLFALALVYPFLPGANSEAFKGVSVLAGLMLSLGATGVVGQIIAGLSLMYSRTLRPGEYVKIGDTEGTVTEVGLFATKLHTGLGEELSLPNAVIFSQPVRNFSRLVQDGQFVLHTSVTIGYATPWRQVHAMLLEAARRTPGVAAEPAPYVVQTALSDFYVEYRLCAQGNRSAPRRRAEAMSQLHAHVQDVFNENGVQIMSPHYLADPPQAQVVPPADWAPPLAPAAPDLPAPQAGPAAPA